MSFSLAAMLLAISPKVDINREIECLASAIHYEARGESEEGKRAVGYVILNRLKSSRFPDTICKIINQKGQFPWARHRKLISNSGLEELSSKLINEEYVDPTEGALFFHNIHEHPRWNKLSKIKQIGKHVFYKY